MVRFEGAGLGRKLLVSAISLVVLFGTWEAALRLTGRTYWSPPLRLKTLEPYFDQELRAEESLYRDDAHVFWRLRPNWVEPSRKDRMNSAGYRGPDLARPKPPGTVRIAFAGDSCTYGVHTDFEETYPARLIERLSALHPAGKFELVNVGVPGYSLYQGTQVFREDAVPAEPDIAVFYFGWNDAKPGYRGSDRDAGLARKSRAKTAAGAIAGVLGHSAVYRMLRESLGLGQGPTYADVTAAWYQDHPLYENRVPLDEFEALMDENLALCRERGIEPIVVVPEVHLPLPPTWVGARGAIQRRWYDRYRDRARAAAERHGAATLDMRTLFEDLDLADLYRARDPVHPNADGYLLLARALADVIVAHGWIASDDPRPARSAQAGGQAIEAGWSRDD